MKNEKLLNILMFVAIFAVGFFLIQRCQSGGGKAPEVPAPSDKLVAPPPVLPALPAPATMPTTEAATTAAIAPETVKLGNAMDPKSPWLEITANNLGAGVDLVRLNTIKYKATVGDNTPLTVMQAEAGTLKPFSVTQVRLATEGKEYKKDAAGVPWEIVERTPTSVVFRLPLYLSVEDRLANRNLIAEVLRRISIDAAESYEITVTNSVKNYTNRAITVAIDQMTSVNLDNDSVQMDYRYIHTAKFIAAGKYVEGNALHDFQPAVAKAIKTPLGTFAGTSDRLLWTAQANRFFTAIVRPMPVGGSNRTLALGEGSGTIPDADWVASAEADTLPPFKAKIETSHVGILYEGTAVEIAAGGQTALPLRAYLGPKDRLVLAGDRNDPVGSEPYLFERLQYHRVIKYGQGWPCALLTYDWLVLAILKLLDWIHIVVGNYGVAIIILVIVVRLLLHPLTRMSQVHMAVMQKKMAAIQPELTRIKKKYEKDKATQTQEIMRVHKENNVNPAGGILGCLPMLIQMPIWLALYAGLAAEISLRHAPFIPGWINDLSNPDTVWYLGANSFTLPMLGHIYGLNVLPILLGVLFFVQMRIQLASQPKPDPTNEQAMQAAQTQKITQWMILLFPVFLYHAPSGLNLYIFASTLGGIFDTWLIRKSLRAKGILPAPMASPM